MIGSNTILEQSRSKRKPNLYPNSYEDNIFEVNLPNIQ